MATTFLTLVNDTLKRLNEVQLTSDEFATAIGFHASVKDAVNIALEEIGQEQFGFPFNHQTGSLTLVAGTSTYAAPSDMKVVDWDSFRIVKDEAENIGAVRLRQINYDTYIQRFYIVLSVMKLHSALSQTKPTLSTTITTSIRLH